MVFSLGRIMTALSLKFLPRHARSRRGSVRGLVLGLLGSVALVCVAIFLFAGRGKKKLSEEPILEEIVRKPYKALVLDQGEVESSNNVEIRCDVQSRNSNGTAILEVVAEGSMVRGGLIPWQRDPLLLNFLAPIQSAVAVAMLPQEWPLQGDLLVRLDSSALQQERDQQQIIVNTSEARVITAQSNLEAAQIAMIEYVEGTFKQDEQTILNEIFEAEENLRKADQYVKYSERLAAKSYVTALQLEADRFAVKKSQNALDLARRKLDVLRNQTKRRSLIEFEALIRAAEVTYDNENKSHEVELTKLEDIQDQVGKCTIRAPTGVSGQVVHANKYSSRGGSAEFVVEEGASVREKQVIIRLPDPQQMQVKAAVNESRITRVSRGMPVVVQLDALNERKLNGEVVRVNQYAEPAGFSSGGIKKYAVFVRILDPPPEIRPGMNASVSIIVDQKDEALQIPLEAIFEQKGHTFCLVRKDDQWETREIELGSNNDQMALLTSGAEEGEQVVLNPRHHKELLNLPEILEEPFIAQVSSKEGGQAPPGAGQDSANTPPNLEGPTADGPNAQGARRSPSDMFKQFDTNADGNLTSDELAAIPERLRDAIVQADANGDQAISKDEFTLGIAEMRKRRGGGGPPQGAG